MKQLRMQVASDVINDDWWVFAYWGDELWAEASQKTGKIYLHSRQDGEPWCFDLAEMLGILQQAQTELRTD